MKSDAEERFFGFVDKTNGCWEWRGSVWKGYGKFWFNGRMVKAHRFSYSLVHGDIEGVLDHLCRNRACVNPDHLEDVSNKENCMRGEAPTAINARKTHCPRGHEYNEENTYVRPTGSRECKVCRNERGRVLESTSN